MGSLLVLWSARSARWKLVSAAACSTCGKCKLAVQESAATQETGNFSGAVLCSGGILVGWSRLWHLELYYHQVLCDLSENLGMSHKSKLSFAFSQIGIFVCFQSYARSFHRLQLLYCNQILHTVTLLEYVCFITGCNSFWHMWRASHSIFYTLQALIQLIFHNTVQYVRGASTTNKLKKT